MNIKLKTKFLPGLLLLSSIGLQAQQGGFLPPQTSWVDWTSDLVANPGGSVAGVMTVGSNVINVSYSGEVFSQTQLNGTGTDYYSPLSTYTNAVCVNPPTNGMITFAGGTSGADTATFSQPLTNPVMAIVSEGSPGEDLDITFSTPFNILSTGPGWWGSGPALTQTGNVLHGAESDGTIQFIGAYTSISWTISGSDSYYTGVTLGATNGPAPIITTIQGGNVTVYTGMPWSMVASGFGTPTLSYQWFCDNARLADQPRLYGSQSNTLTFTNLLVSDSGTYTLTVSNAFGISSSNVTLAVLPTNNLNIFTSYAAAITNLFGLLGYWRFDPVFRMNSCVNGYTGAPSGSASIGAGGSGCPLYGEPMNQALLLDGSSGFVGTSLTGQIGNQGSLLAWVYLSEEPSAAGHIFSVMNQSQAGNNFDVQIETDNLARFYAGGALAVYNQAIPVKQWHFLAATLNTNGTADLFLDGQIVATSSGGGHSVTANPVSIGESQVFTGRFFAGKIDEVAVYNTCLTPAQINALYLTALGPPVLHIQPLAGAVVVQWPTNFAGYLLQTNNSFNGSNWSAVAVTNGIVSTNFVVTNSTAGSQLFYRLKN